MDEHEDITTQKISTENEKKEDDIKQEVDDQASEVAFNGDPIKVEENKIEQCKNPLQVENSKLKTNDNIDRPMYQQFRSSGSNASTDRGITRRLNRNRTEKKEESSGFKKRGRTLRKTIRSTIKAVGEGSAQHGMMPTNEQRLRTFVIREIWHTEQEYLKLLKFINENIIPKLNSVARDTENEITEEAVKILVGNVPDILSLHLKLHEKLQSATDPFPYHNQKIGSCFIEMKEDFHVYDNYCSNFNSAQAMAYKLEKDSEISLLIDDWKKSVESNSRRFIHLEDFIISPVQRVCKYPLLLRELLKYTSDNHPDHKAVSDAHKLMENVTFSVNESERRSLMVQAIKDVESVCDDWENSGFMEKQGFLTKCGGNVKSWNIRWCVLAQFKLQYYVEPVSEEPLGEIDLTAYKALYEDCVKSTNRPFSFGIKLENRVYYMYATSEEQKREWISILKWKSECVDRSRRLAQNPMETAVFSSLSSLLNPRSLRSVENEPPKPPPQPPMEREAKAKSSSTLSFRKKRSKDKKPKKTKSQSVIE